MFKKLLIKHYKLCIICGCIVKNVATAIAFENMIISTIVGLMTGMMVKAHLLDNHHLLHIKKHYPHQAISFDGNSNILKLPKYYCNCCNRNYYSLISFCLHKINII